MALVTGAARGIGQAIAAKLVAAEGADLALCDLQADWLAETAGRSKREGRRAACYAVDVSKAEAVQDAVKKVAEDFGRIDILVNNAGITKDGFLARMSEEDWDARPGHQPQGDVPVHQGRGPPDDEAALRAPS